MKRRIFTLLLAALMLLSACGGTETGNTGDQQSEGQQASSQDGEKVLTIGTYMAVTTLVPWKTTSDGDGYILRQVYQPLVGMNAKSEFTPNLAESWSCADDGVTWTVKLREDCYWQTGNDLFGDEKVNVTAEDVKFSYEYYLDPNNGSVRYTDLSSTIKSIDVVDKYTVQFVTNDIDVLFEYKMYQNYIIPKKGIDENWDFENKPVGSGAYKFVEHVTDTHVILEKNEEFWQMPALDKVVFKIITDKSVSSIALQNKEVDISLSILSTEVANIANTDFLELRAGGTGSYRWVGFNCADPLFTDPEVRKALQMAVDFDGAIQAIFANDAGIDLAVRAYSCIPYERPGGDTDGSAKAAARPYDTAAAEARLDELGWVKGSDGIRAKDGMKMSFTLQVGNNDAAREKLAVIIASQFKAIGVDCTAKTAEWATHTTDIQNGNVQMYILGGYSNLDGGLRLMHTDKESSSPNCNYSNPEVDALLDKAWVTTDTEARSAILRQAAVLFANDAPHLGGYFEYAQMGVNKRVTDFDYASVYHPLCDPTRNVSVINE